MDYKIEIKIPWAEIGCNPTPIEIHTQQSETGAVKLYKYFCSKFGDDNVTLWKNTSEVSYTLLLGESS